MIDETIKKAIKLEDCLSKGSNNDFPSNHPEKSYLERYKEMESKFNEYPVELGALVAGVEKWLTDAKEKMEKVIKAGNSDLKHTDIKKIFDGDPIVFLNRHDGKHTQKVQERVLMLLQHFEPCVLNYYELFLLMCATVVHDVGNIFGRSEHEKDIKRVLDAQCADILPDSVERRIIARVARAHGGLIGESQDTISVLQEEALVNNIPVRERLLAAILRFADELSDDSSRANYAALNSEIIKKASLIYHLYSASLHTVSLHKNEISNTYEIVLAYEFDTKTACLKLDKEGYEQYLIDEIYNRTFKMDRERRYCVRHLRPYIRLERIKVSISITSSKDEFIYYPITYTLEENGYPAEIYKTIKDVDKKILSGEEIVCKLQEKGGL